MKKKSQTGRRSIEKPLKMQIRWVVRAHQHHLPIKLVSKQMSRAYR